MTIRQRVTRRLWSMAVVTIGFILGVSLWARARQTIVTVIGANLIQVCDTSGTPIFVNLANEIQTDIAPLLAPFQTAPQVQSAISTAIAAIPSTAVPPVQSMAIPNGTVGPTILVATVTGTQHIELLSGSVHLAPNELGTITARTGTGVTCGGSLADLVTDAAGPFSAPLIDRPGPPGNNLCLFLASAGAMVHVGGVVTWRVWP